MGDCPNPDCHERVMGHHKTLYGTDGRSGMTFDVNKKIDKGCLNDYMKKVSIPFLIFLFISLIIPGILTGVKVWSQQEINPHIYAEKKEVQIQKERIISLEENCRVMHEDVMEIKQSLRDQKKEIYILFNEIKSLISDLNNQNTGG